MDDYLSKPVTLPALDNILRKYLNEGRAAGSAGGPPAPVAREGAVQIQRLRDISGGDAGFEQELIALFIEDNERHLRTIETAVRQNDLALLERELHALKGSCASAGAHGMEALARRLEESGPGDLLHSARGCLSLLESEFAGVRRAFQAYLDQTETYRRTSCSSNPSPTAGQATPNNRAALS